MPACPAPTELSSLLLGNLPAGQAEELEQHVETCVSCQTTVQTLRPAPDWLADGVREALAPATAGAVLEPACQEAIARIRKYAPEATAIAGEAKTASLGPQPSHPAERTSKVATKHPDVDLGTIREYRLLSKLGEGGMGAVYKAQHTKLRRTVALKMLPASVANSPAVIARFEREMQAVGALDHEHIVRAFDAGESDGRHYLVMEYVKGRDLTQLCRDCSPLSIANACELIRQAAVGLQHAHEAGLVHRDIKPSNLMLSDTGVVKILDLGLALLSTADGNSELTSTGMVMGTIDYMAPEQGGDTHHVDIRADIYSLGATLYRLLTGVAPFGDPKFDTPVKKLMALATQEPTPAQQRRADIPTPLGAVIAKMMAKSPDKRYATPAEVAAALAPFTAGSNLPQLAARAAGDKAAPLTGEVETQPSLKSASVDTLLPAPALARFGNRYWNRFGRWPWYLRWPALALLAMLGGGAAAWALSGIVLQWQTSSGTVRIEILDDKIQAQFDKDGLTIIGADKEPIKVVPASAKPKAGEKALPAGEHKLVITRGDFSFETKSFELRKDKETTIRIELIGGTVVARANGETIGSESAENYALHFDGKEAYVEIPDLVYDAGPITLEATVHAGRTAGGGREIVGLTCPERVVSLWGYDALAGMFVQDLTSGLGSQSPSESKLTGVIHLAGVWDGEHSKIFINGRLVGTDSKTAPGAKERFHAALSYIGGRKDRAAPSFDGLIDEVRISKGARYSADYQPRVRLEPDRNTLALYHFDEGKGDVLRDSSGNNHHGKIVGAEWALVESDSAPGSSDQGFVRMFNDQDLTGWETLRSGSIRWTNEGGLITGRNRSGDVNSAGVLQSKQHYKDFHFRCEVLAGVASEPAILFRNVGSLVRGSRHGYALANPAPTSPIIAEGWGYGSLYADNFQVPLSETRLAPSAEKDLGIKTGDWYRLEIIAQGETIEIRINGKRTARNTSSDPALNRSGAFAIRCGAGATVAMRNLEIKELQPVELEGTDDPAVSPTTSSESSESVPATPGAQVARKASLYTVKPYWSVNGGELLFGSNEFSHQWLFFGDKKWTDYDFQARVLRLRKGSPSGGVSLLFRSAGPNYANTGLFGFGSKGVGIAFNRGNEFFSHEVDGVPVPSHTEPGDKLVNNRWYTLKVEVRGSTVRAFLDGRPVVTFDKVPFAKGKVGLHVNSATYRIRDIQVTAPNGSSLWNGPPDMPPSPLPVPAEYATPGPPSPAVAPFDAAQAKAHQEAWAKHLGVPVEYTNSVGMKFKLIPPGQFVMGSPESEAGRESFDKGCEKQHEVEITKPFYLGTFEVTQEEYEKLTGKNPSAQSSHGKDKDQVKDLDTRRFPVESVSWNDAKAFCKKLAEQIPEQDRTYRLPTEAEWEYAFRAGTTTVFYVGDSLTSYKGNFIYKFSYGTQVQGPDAGHLTPVGSYEPNPFGLHDMIGNVCEWCEDAYEYRSDYYSRSPKQDPWNKVGIRRARRGGAFSAMGVFQRAALRFSELPGHTMPDLGFRVLLEIDDTLRKQIAGEPVEYRNSIGMKFVRVPKGKSWLGGGGGQPGSRAVEFTDDFYLGAFTVTQEEWQKVMGSNPAHFSRNGARKEAVKDISDADLARFPVEGISYAEVEAFLAKLNALDRQEGWEYRLPTSDEWEYACRGGPLADQVESAFSFYAGSPANDLPTSRANFGHKDGLNRTMKVGQFAPNKLGLYDMHGNVLEWCSDVGKDEMGRATRLARGGSWNDPPGAAASHTQFVPTVQYASLGLRVVRDRVDSAPMPPCAIAPFDAAQAKAHQEAWARHLGVPVEYTNSIGMKFKLIPPGEFLMGSTPEQIEAALKAVPAPRWGEEWRDLVRSEGPQHKVILTRPLYLGAHEVTQSQYEQVMDKNPSVFSPTGSSSKAAEGLETSNFPVDSTSWRDAAEFCAKLSQRENLPASYTGFAGRIIQEGGTGYRLPTEAEWEFACRAGTTSIFFSGDTEKELRDVAWCWPFSKRPHAVGELKPNAFGLFDMHGNVWEWVNDAWESDYYAQFKDVPAVDPQGCAAPRIKRIFRSGTNALASNHSRSANRNAGGPGERFGDRGFRVALSVEAVRQAIETASAPKSGEEDGESAKETALMPTEVLKPSAEVAAGKILAPDLAAAKPARVEEMDGQARDFRVVGRSPRWRREYIDGKYLLENRSAGFSAFANPLTLGEGAFELDLDFHTEIPTQWTLALRSSRREVLISLTNEGGVEMLSAQGKEVTQWQAKPTDMPIGAASHKLLLVLRNDKRETYLNGAAVIDPIPYPAAELPAATGMQLRTRGQGAVAIDRFRQFDLPSLPR